MFNLNDFMDNRGIFKVVTFGDAELEIVSLGQDLMDQLKELSTHKMMIDFVAEHGLAHRGVRISEGPKAEALVVIWDNNDMKDAKGEIVDAICDLSDADEVLAAKLEIEELAALEAEEKADKVLDGDGDMPLDVDMGTIEKEYDAHNNAA